MAATAAQNTGAEFEEEGVVAAYVHRTPYPPALFDRLLALPPGRDRLLDLGCGPGKLTLTLAPHFAEVLAVDPSAAMLRLAQTLDAGANPHIAWTEALAEDLPLPAGLDLITAGASIHWMDAPRLFPHLAAAIASDGVMAILGGDGPADAPWIKAWDQTIVDWVGKLGGQWQDPAHTARIIGHQPWFDLAATEVFTAPVTQAVDDLIEAEHSRATWSRAKMGARAEGFDADLRAVVAPYARDGKVTFEISCTLWWGRPRATPLVA
ncbi:MAG: class I SAM-dependent methyltransferase [Phenylobacterium sp.]|uniref:class I SAM-dependent methyltransferase n=1 Tax=Phenylobacterium sp. TaxID=1871053 RepID=UPI00272F646C|nr:class I SAM-dependent methyltransferase [Phenylobacterium sp.]MDP2009939.1 class I SAM-dependent methyltransferase [Phenylobacterium sp.]